MQQFALQVVLRAAAIQLFVEALGIEGVRGCSDGRQSRQSDEGGKDRLHDRTPKCCFAKSVCETPHPGQNYLGAWASRATVLVVTLLEEQTLTAILIRRVERAKFLN